MTVNTAGKCTYARDGSLVHPSERASNEESELEAGISGTPCMRLGRGLYHVETVLAARSEVLCVWSSLQTVLSKVSYQP